ncbi:isocitrate dehydrogenase [Fulvimarina pelagi HTCC2506]|uniref:Isocitrate dehydrogenase n=1 Tax=Fulvimarina pelagi HTCC2506 TaxID=314231 RepID=Q0FZI1_9HYPH|nr:isocitrate dehydrogenase [Fulvimarina pelagi HTCC2506]
MDKRVVIYIGPDEVSNLTTRND